MGPRFKVVFLPFDRARKINSLNSEEVYHSEPNFIRMNEMCANIKLGDVQNLEQI